LGSSIGASVSQRVERGLVALLTGLGGVCFGVGSARAESIERQRSDAYYAGHVGGSAALGLGTLLVERLLLPPHGPGLDWEWFPGDLASRGRFSEAASSRSDVTLWLSNFGPVLAHVGLGSGDSLANAMTAYFEVFAAQYSLNVLVKHVVARPRPYTHHKSARVGGFRRRQGTSEPFLSFYSGHAGMAFASGTSGAFLYGVRSSDAWSRRALWGAEMAFAGATASQRLIAGRHYLSDVVAGALIGGSLGVGIPLLHGYEPPEDPGGDLAWAAAGLAIGAGLPWLLGSAEVVLLPVEPSAFDWSVSPQVAGAPGLSVRGSF
jgi:membrane-associated phospholipid phosphatase